MSIKLFKECPPLPTQIKDKIIVAHLGDKEINIDYDGLNINLVDDNYLFENKDILFYGRSEKGSELVIRRDSSISIYVKGGLYYNSNIETPDILERFNKINGIYMICKSGLKDVACYINESDDMGVLYSEPMNGIFTFSLSKNSRFVSDLLSSTRLTPVLRSAGSQFLEACDEKKIPMYKVFGEYNYIGMEVLELC